MPSGCLALRSEGSIAHAVIAKRERLTPAEIRFLRKFLGWSGADFAAHVGTTP
jgi:DNA-binding transcriptional regulator YiaG